MRSFKVTLSLSLPFSFLNIIRQLLTVYTLHIIWFTFEFCMLLLNNVVSVPAENMKTFCWKTYYVLFYQKKKSPVFAPFSLSLWAERKRCPENAEQNCISSCILWWEWWWFYVLYVSDNNKNYMMMWWMNKWIRKPFIFVHCSILFSFIAKKIA